MSKAAELFPNRCRRRSWAGFYKHRSSRYLKAALAVAFILSTLHIQSTTKVHRQALLDKFSPTTYNHLAPQDETELASTHWKWRGQPTLDSENPYHREQLWAHRDEWTRLGSGFEGEVMRYNDSVIKVFKEVRSPFRNCLPNSGRKMRWPTEIPTSLLLGGMRNTKVLENDVDFLPVTDYFLSPETEGRPPRWHFVTPFLPLGNLLKLAKRLRESEHVYTANKLDTIFRPSLVKLLDALNTMHIQHGLCHDDIKPDNIFIVGHGNMEVELGQLSEARHWILADLGNVREPDHPYHSSLLWSNQRGNLPDCRANDVLRLLKSYMIFLRSSVDEVVAFDVQFWDGSEPWSHLFWQVWDTVNAGDIVSATIAKTQSKRLDPQSIVAGFPIPYSRRPRQEGNVLHRLLFSREHFFAKATADTLSISASDAAARLLGLTSILGVPVGNCKAS